MVMGANRREASSRETSLGFEWNRVNIIEVFDKTVLLFFRTKLHPS